MKIKKSTFILSIVGTAIAAAVITALLVNPFGTGNWADLIVAKVGGAEENLSKFNRALYRIESQFYEDTDADALTDNAIAGMVDSLGDEYSEYYVGDDAAAFSEDVDGNYTGIGLYITNGDDNLVTVISPISGSPAYEAQLAAGDKILAVNGEEVSGEDLDGVSAKMKGEAGTTVDITVFKADSGETVELTLTRAEITLEVVTGKLLDDNIGYIAISQFTADAGSQFVELLRDELHHGERSFIIDLRGNPGGYMDMAIDMADIFLDGGTITYTEDKYGNRQFYTADEEYFDFNLVILINGGSASASELYASALHDNGRAYLIGEKSYGKGVVQSVFLLDKNLLKLTTARYFTPNGVCINGVGVEPDLTVEMSYEDYYLYAGTENDVQLNAAIEYLKSINTEDYDIE